MKFNLIDDREKFISHIVLHDLDLATKISQTDLWKESQESIALITVNGIEVPFEAVESYFSDLAERLEKAALEKYSDLEKEVHRRLEERLEEEARPILEKFYEIQNVLNSPGDLLKPYWERNNA